MCPAVYDVYVHECLGERENAVDEKVGRAAMICLFCVLSVIHFQSTKSECRLDRT